MFENLNYVQRVELLVIVAIVIFAAYVFYSLDLHKKGK
jgi:hypothetical protein